MLEEMQIQLEGIANNSRFWDAIAACAKAQCNAMVRAGFSEADSVAYLNAHGLPIRTTTGE